MDRVLPRLGLPFQAVGFEADPESFARAARAIGDRPARLVHAAVVNEVPAGGTVRLHRQGRGLGNSLYRPEFQDVMDVPAVRLSEWLAEAGMNLGTSVCLLRMNIEGAEADVVEDLSRSGLLDQVDGFFGMWDDVSKTGRASDEFVAALTAHHIRPFTFNGRDIAIRPRMRAIEAALRAAVIRGRWRVASRIGPDGRC